MLSVSRRLAFGVMAALMIAAPLVVQPASAQVTTRGVVGGWTVGQHYRDGRFFRCFASTPGPRGTKLLLSFMGNYDRLLTIDGNYAPVGARDTLYVTLQPGGQRFQFEMVQKPNNGLWTAQALPNSFFSALQRSTRMDTDTQVSRVQRTFFIGDPSAMLGAMDGCLNGNRGR